MGGGWEVCALNFFDILPWKVNGAIGKGMLFVESIPTFFRLQFLIVQVRGQQLFGALRRAHQLTQRVDVAGQFALALQLFLHELAGQIIGQL